MKVLLVEDYDDTRRLVFPAGAAAAGVIFPACFRTCCTS